MADDAPKEGRLWRNIAVSLVATGGLMAASFLSGVVVARLGGPAARGILSMGQSFLAVVGSILSLGLGFSTTWAIGQDFDKRRILGLVHALTLGMLILGGLVASGILLFHGGVPTADLPTAGLFCCFALCLANYSESMRGYFIGVHRIWAYNSVQVGTLAVFIGLNFQLLTEENYQQVLLNLFAAYLFVGIIGFVAMVKAEGIPKWPDRRLATAAVPYGVKASLTMTAEYALLRLDALLLAIFVTTEEIGIYAIGDQLNHVGAWIPLIIGRMIFAESALSTDGAESRQRLGRVVRFVAPFSLLVVAGGAATCWFLIPMVFGEAFRESYIAYLILMPTGICKSVQTQFSTYLTGQGLQKRVIAAGVVGVVTDVVVLFALVPMIGWKGAGIAKGLGYIAQLVLVLRAYYVHKPDDERFRWVLNAADIKFFTDKVRRKLGR